MSKTGLHTSSSSETGGITILVAMSLLILMMVVGFGMTKGSLREAVVAGTIRQGSMVRNVADSGIEWAVYWMYSNNGGNINATKSNGTAANLANPNSGLMSWLLTNNGGTPGVYYNTDSTHSQYKLPNPNSLPTIPSDCQVTVENPNTSAAFTSGFIVSLMQMGKVDPTDISQNPGADQFDPASGSAILNGPNLWAVRSDGWVSYGGTNFLSSKEAWITTPLQ